MHVCLGLDRPPTRLRLYNENSRLLTDETTFLLYVLHYCSHRVGRVGLGWTGVRPSHSGTPLLQARPPVLPFLYRSSSQAVNPEAFMMCGYNTIVRLDSGTQS